MNISLMKGPFNKSKSKKALYVDWPGESRRFPRIYDGSYLHLNNLSKQIRSAIKQVGSKNRLRVLDIGCGNKPYYPFFKEIAGDYVGIDVYRGDYVEAIAMGENLPFQSNTFDIIISTQVLYRVDNPTKMIEEIHRCLKGGGYFFLSTPCIWSTDGAMWLYMERGLKKLLKEFSYIKVEPNCRAMGTFFSFLNLYIVKLRLPFSPIFLLNNLLGLFLDKVVASEIFVINYFVLARK